MIEQDVKSTDTPVTEQLRPANECIRVDKIYDWVLIETNHIQEIPIPEEYLFPIDEARENGHQLQITGSISIPSDISTSIASIIRKTIIIKGRPVEIGCTQILKTITPAITVYDLTAKEVIASFASSFQILERVGLCFPEPFTSDNIILSISSAEAISLSDVPVNGNLIFEIGVCQDLQVLTQVTLEVLASFCQPRDNTIACGTNFVSCDKPTFPKQCPVIFPGS